MPESPEQQQPAQPQPFVPPVAPPLFAPQQTYPQQYGVAPGTAWAQAAPQPPRSRALGIVSMALALAVFVLSVVASTVVGAAAGPLAQRTATSFSFNTGSLSPEQAEAFAPIGVLMGAQMLLGTLLGMVALVLGIVAVATKRGRPFGIVGIVAAAAAPIVSFIVYTVVLAASVPA